MALGLNKAILIGNVGQDPEISYMPNGNTIAKFSLATSEKYKDRDGNVQEKTEWHRLIIFGKLADVAKDYIHKGSRLYVEGKLQTRSWDDGGTKKYMTEIVVFSLLMLDGQGDNQGGDSRPPQNQNRNDYNSPPPDFPDTPDDDLPF